MVTELLIGVFKTIIVFFVNLLPDWTPPSWLVTVTDTLASAVSNIAMLSGWVPIKAIGTVIAFMLACGAVAFALRVGRMVLSVFTGGGGSAA